LLHLESTMKVINTATAIVLLLALLLGGAGRADDAEDNAVKTIQKLGGRVTRDENAEGKPIVRAELGFTKMTDAGLKELTGLKKLKELFLHRTEVTDAGLKELAAFEHLETLYLGGTKVTDAGLKELSGLKQLRVLDLRLTAVTDAGATDLQKALPKLRISLGGNRVFEPKK
jgi:internalin A